jgi:hypothetical protein
MLRRFSDNPAAAALDGTEIIPMTQAGGDVKTTVQDIVDLVNAGAGTVTSVDLANSTGLTASGGPVTGAGSLTYTLSANLQAWHALATSAKQDADTLLTSLSALDFSGNGLKKLRVNAAANNFELVTIPEFIIIACSDEATALTTGTAKVTFRMPFGMTLTEVRASVTTAPTGSTLVVDINEGGVSILSTKLSIDASEKTSTTAATPAVISDAVLADDAEITIDIDQVGSTIAGTGLKVTLLGYKT